MTRLGLDGARSEGIGLEFNSDDLRLDIQICSRDCLAKWLVEFV